MMMAAYDANGVPLLRSTAGGVFHLIAGDGKAEKELQEARKKKEKQIRHYVAASLTMMPDAHKVLDDPALLQRRMRDVLHTKTAKRLGKL